jgi:hypothetical protein
MFDESLQIEDLQKLEDLTLRSITTGDLGYLKPLRHLWSLDIKLGGIRSFAGIEGMESIKYLEIWQVRELHRVDIVAALPGLQNLFLQSLPHLETLPAFSQSRALRRVVVENLKGLRDFSALKKAPALEEFALLQGNKQSPEQLLPVLRNPVVRRVSEHFGSHRKNVEFSRLRAEHGKEEWRSQRTFEEVRPIVVEYEISVCRGRPFALDCIGLCAAAAASCRSAGTARGVWQRRMRPLYTAGNAAVRRTRVGPDCRRDTRRRRLDGVEQRRL